MKYILKIFLIVLLVVAIIGAACWFFLVQRPDLTMSVFAHWGDYFYDVGRYNRAVSLYETACKLSPENANLPVRLAQAYINSGNYTKAEYTLVSAITNNPESVQLYVALSKTYIEQDKILDAEPCFRPKADTTANTLTSPSRLPAARPIAPSIRTTPPSKRTRMKRPLP